MAKKLGHLFQFIRWGLLTGAAAVLALGIDVLPAAAGALTDWGYDSQTRSLTLTIPSNISPSVSVLASDQLLIALPDTQIGDVSGLTVGDGVVNNIVLEQTTPDTLWVIMEFAAGTVLANTQSVVPVGEGAGSAGQKWEIRPVVVTSSGTDPGVIAATPTVNGGGAESLRTPAVDVAQADFPDLPILEPGIVLSEPVSVPPLGDFPPAAAAPSPLPPVAEASRPVISVPDVPEAAASDEVAASINIPAEPPFLGEETFEVPVIDQTALTADRSDEVAENSTVDRSGEVAENSTETAEPVTEVTPEAPAPTTKMDETPVEATATAEREPTTEADVVPGDTVASAPVLQTRVDASSAVESAPAITEFEPPQIDLSAQGVTPQNTTDRWPDPIPFGAPLPR